ncbi:MAG: Fur family transcriptional regulator [Thioalkalivibrionaceae bacterium]
MNFSTLDTATARARLRAAGITGTQPRIAIARVLLGNNAHVNAEDVQARLATCDIKVARATIYNTLRLLTEHGLLREVVVEPQRRFFDTNLAPHHHIFNADTGELFDIPLQRLCTASADNSQRDTHANQPARPDKAITAVTSLQQPHAIAQVEKLTSTQRQSSPATQIEALSDRLDLDIPLEIVGIDVVIRVRRARQQVAHD